MRGATRLSGAAFVHSNGSRIGVALWPIERLANRPEKFANGVTDPRPRLIHHLEKARADNHPIHERFYALDVRDAADPEPRDDRQA